MNNAFIQGTRQKLRFNINGVVSIEQLWDLPDDALEEANNAIHSSYANNTFSLFGSTSMSDDDQLRCAVIEHIAFVRLSERDAAKQAKDKQRHNAKISAAIARQEDKDLENLSAEELRKLLI